MAPHSSTLAWKIPLTEEPGRLQFVGSQRVGHDWSDLAEYSAMCHTLVGLTMPVLFSFTCSIPRRSLAIQKFLWDVTSGSWGDITIITAIIIVKCICPLPKPSTPCWRMWKQPDIGVSFRDKEKEGEENLDCDSSIKPDWLGRQWSWLGVSENS